MSKYRMLNVPLAALDDRDCAWPVNSPAPGGVFIFCADVCEKGQHYCPQHVRMAYQKRGKFLAIEAA